MTIPIMNMMNQPIDPRTNPAAPQMVPEIMQALRNSGVTLDQLYGGYQNPGAMPGGSGWEGAGAKLAWMGDKRRAGQGNARLDAVARQMGFPDYATWRNWQARRDEMRGGGPGARGQMGDAVNQGMSWHPAWLLDYVNNKIKGAIK